MLPLTLFWSRGRHEVKRVTDEVGNIRAAVDFENLGGSDSDGDSDSDEFEYNNEDDGWVVACLITLSHLFIHYPQC